jgi:hypothetical protein
VEDTGLATELDGFLMRIGALRVHGSRHYEHGHELMTWQQRWDGMRPAGTVGRVPLRPPVALHRFEPWSVASNSEHGPGCSDWF